MKSIQKCASITTLWATLVADELVRLGVKMVCIAPGSRSTPLVAACAIRPELEKIVCQDERSAGFFALGYARAQLKPAVVITTSGSAVANLWPAVVEASVDRVPLLLLTGDRPPELRAVGSNQTINQVRIFGDYARWFVDMPVPDVKVPLRFVLSSVDEAIHKSVHPVPGPVHLNFMFREPFVPDAVEAWDEQLLSTIEPWTQSRLPLTQHFAPRQVADASTIAAIAQLVSSSESGIIVVGAMHGDGAQASILAFAQKVGWPVVPDVLSPLRFHASPQIAHYADFSLLDDKLRVLKADVVIQVGGRIVSKRLQQYLDSNRCRAHIFLDEHNERLDPACTVTHRVESQIAPFFDSLSHVMPAKACIQRSRNDAWLASSKIVADELESLDSRPSLNEITVARSLLAHLSDENFLFVSSSMPIRDLNMFGRPMAHLPRLFANRGASGIDGIISTACGVAKSMKKRGVLFCGDLTFLHDTNGLSLMKSLELPMVIVVVNNQGGGIFTMLDIHRHKEIFTPYFDAEHTTDLGALCAAHAINHRRIDDIADWLQAVEQIADVAEHLVIEVTSDKWKNRDDHERFREAMSARFRS